MLDFLFLLLNISYLLQCCIFLTQLSTSFQIQRSQRFESSWGPFPLCPSRCFRSLLNCPPYKLLVETSTLTRQSLSRVTQTLFISNFLLKHHPDPFRDTVPPVSSGSSPGFPPGWLWPQPGDVPTRWPNCLLQWCSGVLVPGCTVASNPWGIYVAWEETLSLNVIHGFADLSNINALSADSLWLYVRVVMKTELRCLPQLFLHSYGLIQQPALLQPVYLTSH